MSDRATWLEARKTGLGGSDAAAVLGLSPYKTPFQVYAEKRGEAPPQDDNDAMRWGRYLEPVIRQAYADETGREVRLPAELIRHPLHPWMIANIDGAAGGAGEPMRIFEAKTARTADGWGEPGTDEVPQPYLLQVQHYMEVTGVAVADVAVLIGGSDFRIYEVPADRELQQLLVDAEADFWACVQRAEPPEPVSFADVVARFGRHSSAGLVLADDDVLRALAELAALKRQRQHLDIAEDEWKAVAMKALGERDTLVDGTGRCLATWKAAKPAMRFDAAAFKAAHPELHAQFLAPGEPARRFLIK